MRYAIFLKEINLSIFSFFSYMRNLNILAIKFTDFSLSLRIYGII